MLRDWARVVRRLVMALDGAVIVLSFVLAAVLRSWMSGTPLGPRIQERLWLLWVIGPTMHVALRTAGFYESIRYASYASILRKLSAAHAASCVTIMSVIYLSHAWEVSRLMIQMFFAISFALLLGEKMAIRVVQRWVRARGRNTRNVLVVGTDALSERYRRRLERHPFWGLTVIGRLAHRADGGQPGGDAAAPPVLGTIADLAGILVKHPVDEVAFAAEGVSLAELQTAVVACAEKGVTARVVLDLPGANPISSTVEVLDGLPVLSFQSTPAPGFDVVVKRAMDILGAVTGLAVFACAYCWYGPRIKRTSPGPVLFKQTRVGQNGRPFVVYKFRTMVDGADRDAARLVPRNAMAGPIFKVRDDPRVTPIGRWLRARHLDELPQFWNVLRGEMSLVGTRPPTPDEVGRYQLRHHSRLAWKPGLTGMWQVAGHGRVSDFDDVVRLDREYVRRWSLRLDLEILAKTIGKIVRAEGW
jgi:exopolysaccharide biosynthesis polyprenyl glycosylphosphotransferase